MSTELSRHIRSELFTPDTLSQLLAELAQKGFVIVAVDSDRHRQQTDYQNQQVDKVSIFLEGDRIVVTADPAVGPIIRDQ